MDAQNGKDSGAWCYYSNNVDTGKIFGCLYNYYAVVDPRGIAPDGYHVANANDYLTLINNLGGTNAAGGILKDTTKGLPQSWEIYNTKAYNSIGFTALPAGRREVNGDFFGLNKFLNFYTPIIGIDGKPLLVFINYNNSLCSIGSGGDKQYGFSVRCVKNIN